MNEKNWDRISMQNLEDYRANLDSTQYDTCRPDLPHLTMCEVKNGPLIAIHEAFVKDGKWCIVAEKVAFPGRLYERKLNSFNMASIRRAGLTPEALVGKEVRMFPAEQVTPAKTWRYVAMSFEDNSQETDTMTNNHDTPHNVSLAPDVKTIDPAQE